MIAQVYSAQLVGLDVYIIDVEIDISKGIRSFNIVGLPDKAVEEAKDRINAAIKNSGLVPPQKGNRKIVVSLAPADIKKEGPIFDLAIAIGNLLASKTVVFDPKNKLFLGELALNGDLRPVKGILSIVRKAAEKGFQEIFVPVENAKEAALIKNISVFGARNLKEVVSHLQESDDQEIVKIKIEKQPETVIDFEKQENDDIIDFAHVAGQENVKRALEIAAAGGHNIAMYGPPGTGKTMLAKALPGILPNLSFEEVLEVTSIYSSVGLLNDDLITNPPFRSPHHTSSYVSLVGGGTWPKPGEITLAHRGVLFLDEFPEFEKRVIESLRQPLEDKVIHVSRARGSVKFPADFILVAAMNPCPCGNKDSETKECICSQGSLFKYERKISGPIIDRIDIWINVPNVDYKKLSETESGIETSKTVRERVGRARQIQASRFRDSNHPLATNGHINAKELKTYASLDEKLSQILNMAAEKLNLSARSYHRVIKVARTIADLENSEKISENHLLEALQYRPQIS